MIGTIVNTGTILVGSVIGSIFQKGIQEKQQQALYTAMGLAGVCLFEELQAAMDFDAYVYERLMAFPNKEEIFGRQLIYNTKDAICGTVQNLLINATSISFEGLWELVKSFGGVMFPAHVDKTANSLIANLGFIPPDSKFVTAEVKDLTKLHKVRKENPYLEKCRIISNSDAHYLEDIHEPKLTLQVREKSVKGVLEALAGGI